MRWNIPVIALSAVLAAGCAAPPPPLPAAFDPGNADIVLLGEQHDADPHRDIQLAWVDALARSGRLAAVAIEMAERGYGTRSLSRSASEGEVQKALGWNEYAWKWERYAPPIMAAVRAGVPVIGANLPDAEIRPAMNNTAWDGVLPRAAWDKQLEAIRVGHCNLLPSPQVPRMARVQVARDFSMANTLAAAAVQGKTVVLLAGGGHVSEELGVPRHLPPNFKVRPVHLPEEPPKPGAPDYCDQLRNQQGPTGVM